MRDFLVAMWSTLLWRGALSIAFGLCAFAWPGNFMIVLAVIFGIYALIDGLLTLWGAYVGKAENKSRLIAGVLGAIVIAIGLLALFAPSTVIRYLVLVIGLWNIYIGVLQIFTAFALRKELPDSGWQAFAGVVPIIFGLVISYYWWAGVLTIAWLIGTAAIVTGLVLLWLGFKLRLMSKRMVKDQ
jgi:uncharacterized membrane protein HdeD (DUF308 family)